MRDTDVAYKLMMYGDERIEDETLYFDRLAPAVMTVELQCTDDTNSWSFEDGNAQLIDYNSGHGVVINKITTVDRNNVSDEIHRERVL